MVKQGVSNYQFLCVCSEYQHIDPKDRNIINMVVYSTHLKFQLPKSASVLTILYIMIEVSPKKYKYLK